LVTGQISPDPSLPNIPLQRVLNSSQKTVPQIEALKATLKNTDPFEQSRHIDQQLDWLYNSASQRNGAVREKAPLRQRRSNSVPATRARLTSAQISVALERLDLQQRQQYEIQRQIRTQPSVRFSH